MSAKTSTTEFIATGRRKTSSARVRIKEGTGNFLINGKEYSDYCSTEESRKIVLSPLASVDMVGGVDITVNVSGGGASGQAGAIQPWFVSCFGKNGSRASCSSQERRTHATRSTKTRAEENLDNLGPEKDSNSQNVRHSFTSLYLNPSELQPRGLFF